MESTFRFNFGESAHGETSSLTDGKEISLALNVFAAKEHSFESDQVHAIDEIVKKEFFSAYEVKAKSNNAQRSKILFYRSSEAINDLTKKKMEISDNLVEIIEHSDLNAGIYEGGFKVWESSFDLVEFLETSNVELAGKHVLEIGCGAGLPGIYSLLSGSSFVCFQDFNSDVVELFTIPNVFYSFLKQVGVHADDECDSIESSLENLRRKCLFMSGDWRATTVHLQEKNKNFDVILSSETIYNPVYYPALHKFVCNSLRKCGVALFANKSYYFGVGGSTNGFMDYVSQKGLLKAVVAMQILDGVRRDVIKLEWKKT